MADTFRTVCNPAPAEALSLQRPWLMLGSCFTGNIGSRLRRRMVNVAVNPTGILFNPLSIAAVVRRALDGKEPEYELHGDLWNSWMLPGEFSSTDRDEALRLGREAFATLREALMSASTMIITFGTAIIYALARPPYSVVANCHKRPAAEFIRDMLPPAEIIRVWGELLSDLRLRRPDLRIIFTVSPVRHLKEGFHANTLSKATLQLAIAGILRECPGAEYFPAYELLNDDLRDYRFYAEDMTHPSPTAVDYIYRRFEETYLSEADRKTLDEALALRRRLEHRPLHPDTDAARRFAAETDRLLTAFLAAHPRLHP